MADLKKYMVNCLHRLYRRDKWVNQLFNAAGVKLDECEQYIDEVYGNNFFDTATDEGLIAFEREAGITTNEVDSVLRVAALRAKWVGSSKATLEVLQAVADSWKNGLIELSFVDGKIKVDFTSPIGVPNDIEGLKNALENVKPAHLAIYYVFKYVFWFQVKAGTFNNGGITWRDYKNNKQTWRNIKSNS